MNDVELACEVIHILVSCFSFYLYFPLVFPTMKCYIVLFDSSRARLVLVLSLYFEASHQQNYSKSETRSVCLVFLKKKKQVTHSPTHWLATCGCTHPVTRVCTTHGGGVTTQLGLSHTLENSEYWRGILRFFALTAQLCVCV